MFNKKTITAILSIAMAAASFTGCSSDNKSSGNDNTKATVLSPDASKSYNVVCTIFPEYDWVKEIIGDHADNFELSYLLDSGIDLHNYQPTADDIIKISTCDLFIYVGGESDKWAEDAIAQAANKNMKVINLMDILGDSAKVEELKEGMQESEHEHGHTEINEADIKDRELEDFAGSWQSLYPFLESGDLDGYVKKHAEENDETEDDVRKELEGKWNCDATEISVDGNKISFTYNDGSKASGEYKYAGYSPILADDGDIRAVMYQFEAVSGDSPKYVMFNDHGYEPAKAEHFHIYYGNDADFKTTKENFSYNPFFIPAGLNGEEAAEVLESHGKGKDDHEHKHEKKEISEDRTLSDYEGKWQSVYPFMDEKFKKATASYMAEAEGFDSEDEAWEFFYKGNETDIRYVNINGDSIEFIKEDGKKTSGTYEYDGYYSDCWGETSIRYQFKNTDNASDAPKYVQFDDHLNYPAKAEHFHVYCGDDAKAMLDIKYNWPTYYPADIESEDDMIHEFLKHYITDEDEDDHDHEHEDGEVEYDEHVWLSLKNAKVLCAEIENNLEAIDPANASSYKANLDSYISKLSDLDNSFQTLVDSASVKTLVFGDRFPFRYFVDDYGLDYFAAFIGCSAESEASFETIKFLSDKIKELDCDTVFTLENSNKDIANAIISNSGKKDVKIAELNSLQSVSKSDISSGASYISLMQKNYDVLAGVMK